MGLLDRDYQGQKKSGNTLRDKFKEHEKTLKASRKAVGANRRIPGIFVVAVLAVALLAVWIWKL